jgi:hypothetical protein
LRLALDLQDEVTDVDLVVLGDRLFAGDLTSVDVGPVGALQIDDLEVAFLSKDTGVSLRYVPFGEDDVVPLHPPDRDLGLVELERRLLASLFTDRDGVHGRKDLRGSFEKQSHHRWPVENLT